MVRRGTTLVEMLLVVGLTGIVIGTLTLLYGFTFSRAAHTMASYAATDQASKVLDEIADTASHAISCEIVTSGTQNALKCTMPASGTDIDGDGYIEIYKPSSVSRRGIEQYAPGKRIYFFLAGTTGVLGTAGTIPWRAQRSDDSMPTGGDKDTKWTYYYGSSAERYGLITTLTFTVDSAAKTTTVTVQATSLIRSDSEAGAEAGSRGTYSVSYTRTVYWGSS